MKFQKGVSGNPGGRPKRGWTWSGVLAEAVRETVMDTKGKPVKIKEAIAKSLIKESLKGNVLAIKELFNRMDGMPVQDITSGGDKLEFPTIYKPEKKKI